MIGRIVLLALMLLALAGCSSLDEQKIKVWGLIEPEQQGLYQGRVGYAITANNEFGLSGTILTSTDETTEMALYWLYVRPEPILIVDNPLNLILGPEQIEGRGYAGSEIGFDLDHDRDVRTLLVGVLAPLDKNLEAVGEWQYQKDRRLWMFGLRWQIP